MELRARYGSLSETKSEFTAMFILEDKDLFQRQAKALTSLLRETPPPFENGAFTGKPEQTLLLYPHRSPVRQLLLVGLGKARDLHPERLRRGAAAAVDGARRARARSFSIIDPLSSPGLERSARNGMPDAETVGQALGEGAVLGGYSYENFLTDKDRKTHSLQRLDILCNDPERTKALTQGLQVAAIVSRAAAFARDLGNTPGNALSPRSLAAAASKAGREHGFSVSVFDEKKISRLKMGGLIAVSSGSANPPRFIILEYRGRTTSRKPEKRYGPIVLVGKGITFDSGGLSIKPSAGMGEQKIDMAGAAAVIGTIQAAASLRLPVRLVGLIPSAENLPSGTALRPGDIITHYNGTTTEVENTDAEGRLILADALSFASRYSPRVVIDLATLTGACVVALGHCASGMMGNDQTTMDRMHTSGDRTGERVWQLPLYDEYDKLIKSDIADVKNTGGRWAGAVTAGMFLKKFIGTSRWVHLDIAGTALAEETSGYIPKGASGVGVRLLTDFLRYNLSSY